MTLKEENVALRSMVKTQHITIANQAEEIADLLEGKRKFYQHVLDGGQPWEMTKEQMQLKVQSYQSQIAGLQNTIKKHRHAAKEIL